MKVKLREASRKFKNWSLYRLAKELNIKGQCVYSWANKRYQITYKNLDRICKILGCKISDILEEE